MRATKKIIDPSAGELSDTKVYNRSIILEFGDPVLLTDLIAVNFKRHGGGALERVREKERQREARRETKSERQKEKGIMVEGSLKTDR